MSEFTNGLTPAQAERLALLAEECGEVVQAVAKILRHGYESVDPTVENSTDNRWLLESEIGDVLAAVKLLARAGDASTFRISDHKDEKLARVKRWLHHADAAPGGGA